MSLLKQFQINCLLLQEGCKHKSITELLELITSPASPSGEGKMSFLNRGSTFPVSGGCGFVAGKFGTLLPHQQQKGRMDFQAHVCARERRNQTPVKLSRNFALRREGIFQVAVTVLLYCLLLSNTWILMTNNDGCCFLEVGEEKHFWWIVQFC